MRSASSREAPSPPFSPLTSLPDFSEEAFHSAKARLLASIDGDGQSTSSPFEAPRLAEPLVHVISSDRSEKPHAPLQRAQVATAITEEERVHRTTAQLLTTLRSKPDAALRRMLTKPRFARALEQCGLTAEQVVTTDGDARLRDQRLALLATELAAVSCRRTRAKEHSEVDERIVAQLLDGVRERLQHGAAVDARRHAVAQSHWEQLDHDLDARRDSDLRHTVKSEAYLASLDSRRREALTAASRDQHRRAQEALSRRNGLAGDRSGELKGQLMHFDETIRRGEESIAARAERAHAFAESELRKARTAIVTRNTLDLAESHRAARLGETFDRFRARQSALAAAARQVVHSWQVEQHRMARPAVREARSSPGHALAAESSVDSVRSGDGLIDSVIASLLRGERYSPSFMRSYGLTHAVKVRGSR